MTDLAGRKPILCLDFDGVCHLYTSGWKGAAVIPDAPVAGLWEFLAGACHEFEVDIFSSRSNQAGGLLAMERWFEDHCPEWAWWILKEIKFPTEKPPAFVGIDDRVLTFTGTWPDIQSLKQFKTWTGKAV